MRHPCPNQPLELSARVSIVKAIGPWYSNDNSATDGIKAYLGRKGQKTGAEKLRTANPRD